MKRPQKLQGLQKKHEKKQHELQKKKQKDSQKKFKLRKMRLKKLRKKKTGKARKPGSRGSKRWVRIPRDQVLQIHSYAGRGDSMGAEQLVRLLLPQLTPPEVEQVVRRCGDPQGEGGIKTGHDPKVGEYADILIG